MHNGSDAPQSVDLAQIRTWYDQGRYQTCWQALQGDVPVWRWRQSDWCVIGNRLAKYWGDPLLAEVLLCRAQRAAPDDPDVRYFRAWQILARRGPVAALAALDSQLPVRELTQEQQAHLHTVRVQALTNCRDFQEARRWYDEARRLSDDRWVRLCEANLLLAQDRRPEGLATVEAVLADHPWYRPAVECRTQILIDSGRKAEARAYLDTAMKHLEVSSLAGQAVVLAMEDDDLLAAQAGIERLRHLQPLAAEAQTDRLQIRLALSSNDLPLARQLAERIATPFWQRLVQRLEKPVSSVPVLRLPVPVERQSHDTCAPATLVALARFWGRTDLDQATLSNGVCYGGTPAHKARTAMEEAGFLVREFRVDVPTTIALIERGLPFALETHDFTSGHLQAVFGIHPAPGLLLVRDPSIGFTILMDAEMLCESEGGFGPRGMIILPREHVQLLDTIKLPESVAYDTIHRISLALEGNNRADAIAALTGLEDGSRLAWWGRQMISSYDQDRVGLLAAIDGLSRLFPEDRWLAWRHLDASVNLEPPATRIAHTQRLAGPKADPLFHRDLAGLFFQDARQHPEAHRRLRLAARGRPLDRGVLRLQAWRFEEDGDFVAGMRLRRLASCLAPTDEALAEEYANACRRAGQTETGMAHLYERDTTWRPLSRAPALTVHRALVASDREDKAAAWLGQLAQEWPDDSEVLIARAWDAFGTNRHSEAVALVRSAQGRVPTASLLRQQADLLAYEGERQQAIELIRLRLNEEPLSLDLHGRLCRWLADQEGLTAVEQHLEDLCRRFPYHIGVREMQISWLREGDPARAERATKDLLERHEDNVWAWRELAWNLLEQDRMDEAEAATAAAIQRAPEEVSTHLLVGDLAVRRGNIAEALAAFRCAQERDPQNPLSSQRLLSLITDPVQIRTELEHLAELLTTRFHDGEVVFTWHQVAERHLDSEAVLAGLDRLAKTCGGWQVEVCRIMTLRRHGRGPQALEQAQNLTTQRSSMPRAWDELGLVQQQEHLWTQAEASFRQAMLLSPGWGAPSMHLIDLLTACGRRSEAQDLIATQIRREPRQYLWFGYKADLCERAGDSTGAVEALTQALRLDPDYDWAWNRLSVLDMKTAVLLALQRCADRPGSAEAWWRLALLQADNDRPQALSACDRALQTAPRLVKAHDLRAYLLSCLGRIDEAVAVADPKVWPDGVPNALVSRTARILVQQGRWRDGMAKIRQALQTRPTAVQLWWALLSAAEAGQDRDAILDALSSLEKLCPCDAHVAWQRASHCLDNASRQTALERVLELDPLHAEATAQLANLALQENNLARTEQVLSRASALSDDVMLNSVRLQFLHKAQRFAEIPAIFERICRHPQAWSGLLDENLATIAGVDAVLQGLIERPPPTSAAAALTSTRLLALQDWNQIRPVIEALERSLPQQDSVFLTHLVAEWIEDRVEAKWNSDLQEVMNHRNGLLLSLTPIWGKVGYCLCNLDDTDRLMVWSRSWQQHSDAQGWMLSNAAAFLRITGKRAEARPIHQHAVTQNLDMRGHHASWLALLCKEAGDTAEQQQAQAIVTSVDKTDRDEVALELIRALEAETRTEAQWRLNQALAQAKGSWAQREVNIISALVAKRWNVSPKKMTPRKPRPLTHTKETTIPWWIFVIAVVIFLRVISTCSETNRTYKPTPTPLRPEQLYRPDLPPLKQLQQLPPPMPKIPPPEERETPPSSQ